MEHAFKLVNSLVEARRNTFKSPKPDAPRLLAFDLLTEVNRNGGYSNLLLPQALSASKLELRDKALVTELLYGTLRMQGRHDWILQQISDRPWVDVDAGVVDICRLGVHQIHEMRIPDHAAVAATVEVARKRVGESKASFVNALLRSVTRKSAQDWFAPLQDMQDPVERLAITYSHPEWIVSAYFDLLKNWEEVELALKGNNAPAHPTLVAWPGYSTQADLIALGAVATPYSNYGAVFDGNPGSLEIIKKRLAGVQDEGSQLVATIFAKVATPRKKWLDLCAGPGGKAALLSSIATIEGAQFTANEISSVRAKLVEQVVYGKRVWVGDGREIGTHNETFDAILIDAPCTGLGALRRRPEVRWRRSVKDLRELTQLQRELIDSAFSVLEIGGVIGYATCSPHLAETRVQVMDTLKNHPQLELVNIADYLPKSLSNACEGSALTLWNHRQGTDSMFLAIFKRVS